MSKKTLIIDDLPLIRLAIHKLLEPLGFEIVGKTAGCINALQMIETLEPEMVILDISLEKIYGLTLLKRIVNAKLNSRVLVYTSQTKSVFALRCFQAGASGFVGKNEPITQLIEAAQTVANGYVFPSPAKIPLFTGIDLPSRMNTLGHLTNRELQVLQLLAEGFNNMCIAAKLNLSNKTVSSYKINLMTKLGVSSVVDLANIAKLNKLI